MKTVLSHVQHLVHKSKRVNTVLSPVHPFVHKSKKMITVLSNVQHLVVKCKKIIIVLSHVQHLVHKSEKMITVLSHFQNLVVKCKEIIIVQSQFQHLVHKSEKITVLSHVQHVGYCGIVVKTITVHTYTIFIVSRLYRRPCLVGIRCVGSDAPSQLRSVRCRAQAGGDTGGQPCDV